MSPDPGLPPTRAAALRATQTRRRPAGGGREATGGGAGREAAGAEARQR